MLARQEVHHLSHAPGTLVSILEWGTGVPIFTHLFHLCSPQKKPSGSLHSQIGLGVGDGVGRW
jgi:hypothetical protein